MTRRRKCLHRGTSTNAPCQNYADTCPHITHRRVISAQTARGQEDATETARDADSAFTNRSSQRQPSPQYGEARRLPPELESDLRGCVLSDTEMSAAQIEKDYWLHAALQRLSTHSVGIGCGTEQPSDGSRLLRPFRSRSKPGVFDVVFAGGTALVSQWDLCERFSEDLDFIIVNRSGVTGHSQTEDMSRVVADICTDAITEQSEHGWEPRNDKPHPMQVQGFAARDEIDGYAKVDVTESVADLLSWEHRPVMSLMGRYASDEMRRDFPELGGFTLPSLHFTVTIGNKMQANVNNVDRGRLDKLAERARDLFDIASAAADSDARDEIIDHLNMCVMNAEIRNDNVGQRALAVTRFPDSPALLSGTPENEALEDGYRYVLDSLAWRPGEAPSFETAVEAARSLRPDN